MRRNQKMSRLLEKAERAIVKHLVDKGVSDPGMTYEHFVATVEDDQDLKDLREIIAVIIKAVT